jgi:hypothetical protein
MNRPQPAKHSHIAGITPQQSERRLTLSGRAGTTFNTDDDDDDDDDDGHSDLHRAPHSKPWRLKIECAAHTILTGTLYAFGRCHPAKQCNQAAAAAAALRQWPNRLNGPAGSTLPDRHDSAHGYRSWWSLHPYDPITPAPYGYPAHSPADGWRNCGARCAEWPAW